MTEWPRCPPQPVNSPGQVQGLSDASVTAALALAAADSMPLSRRRLLKAGQHCRPPTEGVTHIRKKMQSSEWVGVGGCVRAAMSSAYQCTREAIVKETVAVKGLMQTHGGKPFVGRVGNIVRSTKCTKHMISKRHVKNTP